MSSLARHVLLLGWAVVVLSTERCAVPRAAEGATGTALKDAAARPVDVEQFFVEPDQEAVLDFLPGEAVDEASGATPSAASGQSPASTPGPKPSATQDATPRAASGQSPGGSTVDSTASSRWGYVIRDYWGTTVRSGVAEAPSGRGSDRRARVTVSLPPGYYDIELPAMHLRCGIVSLPARGRAAADPFFAIDSAASWLVRDDALRRGLVRGLARCGILTARERLTWGAVHPAPDRWDWETPARFESLRRLYAAEGVAVLEMAHDAPAWMGRVAKYPDDLVAAARSWRAIGARWRDTWGGLEIWNEPDIFFGGDLPADQYAAMAKALAWAWDATAGDKPLLGGAMAHANRRFLDTAARNGLLDACDVFSFHTYAQAPRFEAIVAEYRAWLNQFGRESMPLWVTECGRPWPRGADRPESEPDALSALDITMKAVEAKACGVARYFAFVHPFYEENQNNFGMMGREGTPLRSMAAYAQAARRLAGLDYLGDLRLDDPAASRARVFAASAEAPQWIGVIYTGKPDPRATVRFDLPVARLEGIDGRKLEPGGDQLPVPDGLVYVWLDRAAVEPRLVRQTAAAALRRAGAAEPIPRPKRGPIVLRFQPDPTRLKPCAEGYRSVGAWPGELVVTVRVFHLGDQHVAVRLKAAIDAPGATVVEPIHQRVEPPAPGCVDARWTCRIPADALAEGRTVRVRVDAEVLPDGENASAPAGAGPSSGDDPGGSRGWVVSPLSFDLLPAK